MLLALESIQLTQMLKKKLYKCPHGFTEYLDLPASILSPQSLKPRFSQITILEV